MDHLMNIDNYWKLVKINSETNIQNYSNTNKFKSDAWKATK